MAKEMMSRRRFLTASAASVAGAFHHVRDVCARVRDKEEKHFVYRTLGKTGIKVPVIGMGILNASTPALMSAAVDSGITHFDSTASQPQQIRNEEMIGRVLKGRSRDSFVFGTKVFFPRDHKTGLYHREIRETEFLKKLDEALKRLQMEYVDILYHHMVPNKKAAFYEPVMNAMEKAKKAGKARFHGITTHINMPEVVQAAADSSFYEVVMTSYNDRQKNRGQVKSAIANAASAGLGVVAIKIITGNVTKGQKPVNARASLKWVLQDPNVHATIPGFSNFEEMREDLSVMENLVLSENEMFDLAKVGPVPDFYCQGCERCIQQCTYNLPIPDLMRAYMYAYGYHQPSLAHSLINSLDLQGPTCNDCTSCSVLCSNNWNVQKKIQDIIRLQEVPPCFLD